MGYVVIIFAILLVFFVYLFFTRSLTPEEMRRKSDARLLRALALAEQSSNKNDLPVVLAEVNRRGLLKEKDSVSTVGTSHENLQNKPLMTKDQNHFGFYEIGAGIVLPSLQGAYGKLLEEVDELNVLLPKLEAEGVTAQAFHCCLTISAYYVHLLKLGATEDEILEFNNGVRSRFDDIRVNEKKLFSSDQIDHWVDFYKQFVGEVLKECGDNPNDFKPYGSISSKFFMDRVYLAYGIAIDDRDPSFIYERMHAQLWVDAQLISTLQTLEGEIFRSDQTN